MNRATFGLTLLMGVWTAVAAAPLHGQNDIAIVHRLLLDEEMVIETASGEPRRAALADRLNNNDVVSTSANTRAALRFTDDGSLLRVNPNSQVTIRAEGERGSLVKTLQLDFGELWARVESQGTPRFQVQTPAGVAAVKGTEFIVRVDENGLTTVITLEGLLDFFNDVGTIEIPAGFQGTADAPGTPPDLAPVPEETLQEIAGLVEDPDAPGGDDDFVEIRIPGVDAQGQPTTIVLTVPRSEVESSLTQGGQ